MSNQSNTTQKSAEAEPAGGNRTPKVDWDDSKMRTTYANVVNAASSREEVSIFFGTNQTWNIDDSREVTVQLSDRMILSPFAAKRLWVLLGAVLKQYEQRFGTLGLEGTSKVPETFSPGSDQQQ